MEEAKARLYVVAERLATSLPADMQRDDTFKLYGGILMGLYIAHRHPEGVPALLFTPNVPVPSYMEILADFIFEGDGDA